MGNNLRTDWRIIWAIALKDIGDALKNKVIWSTIVTVVLTSVGPATWDPAETAQ